MTRFAREDLLAARAQLMPDGGVLLLLPGSSGPFRWLEPPGPSGFQVARDRRTVMVHATDGGTVLVPVIGQQGAGGGGQARGFGNATIEIRWR